MVLEKMFGTPTEITYTVTVTLKKTPTETVAGSFIIELTATSTADVDLGA